MNQPVALQARNIVAGYQAADVLRGVSIDVPRGGCVALIGANGAGKTTLLSCLSGMVLPRQGRVRLLDEEVSMAPPEVRLRLGLAHCPEGRRVFATMTVLDNLMVGAHVCDDRAERSRRMHQAYSRFPKLYERRRQLAGTLSGGEQQMLALARALMAAPQVLLLDEPSLGLAPKIVAEVFAHLGRLQQEGVSLLLVEQNASLALKASDYAYVMAHGRIAFHGVSSELAQDHRVQHAYLGT